MVIAKERASGNCSRLHDCAFLPENHVASLRRMGIHVRRSGLLPHKGGPRYLGMSTTTAIHSSSSLMKSTTCPDAPLTMPCSVHKFWVTMTDAPTQSVTTLSRPHASLLEAAAALAQEFLAGKTATGLLNVELRCRSFSVLRSKLYRSDKEREKCRNTLVAQQKKAHKEQAERQKVQAADERRAKRSREEAEKARRDESNQRNHCSQCGGTHR